MAARKAKFFTSLRHFCLVPFALCLAGAAQNAPAQAYPAKPVRIIVPSPAGGGTDTSARFISPRLTELLGQQVIIENRAGAATMIGVEAAARSAPDGYTLLLANSSMAILPSMRKNVRMDILRGVTPIT